MTKKIKEKFKKAGILIISLTIFLILSCSVLADNINLENQINTIISNNNVENNNENSKQSKNIDDNRFAFVFFYMSSCPHCQRFDPILKQFSVTNHISVLAYTLDGNSLPDFSHSFNPTQNELLKFFPTQSPVVPTLFLMDQAKHRIYPMMQGEATMNQLSERFSELKNEILSSTQNANNQQDLNHA